MSRRMPRSNAATQPTILANAEPASEFWLAHIDPTGSNYAQSPVAFGIELAHRTRVGVDVLNVYFVVAYYLSNRVAQV